MHTVYRVPNQIVSVPIIYDVVPFPFNLRQQRK